MNTKHQPLNLDELKKTCSSIFTEQPSSHVSEKYTHIPTTVVVEDMMKLGWDPVKAKQVTVRKGNDGYQKHLIVFQNENLLIKGDGGDDSYVQLLLTNSHNGKCSFRFEVGIFRLICSNGLVVKSTDLGSLKIRHVGYTFDELQTQLNQFISSLDKVVEKMNVMQSKNISIEEAKQIAQRALQIRFNNKDKYDDNLLNNIITPTRIEDNGESLWKFFNVIQERIVNGDFRYQHGLKTRKARKIKNFQQDMMINQQLWEMAEEFIG
jgi:hypothetical protein